MKPERPEAGTPVFIQIPERLGAPAFLDFLEHELIPFVDRTYRTNPADRGQTEVGLLTYAPFWRSPHG